MPFTDEQPYLDAIAVKPHDDDLRLIYADYFDRIGDSDRAELVRVQVLLERIGEDHSWKEDLAEREAELLATNLARWSEPFQDLVIDVKFRRGVLDSVSMEASAFLERGEELFRRLAIGRVRLRDSNLVLDRLVNSPLLGRIRELDLCDNSLGNGGISLLTASTHLRGLESLDLGYNGIDDRGVLTLARASSFPNLTALSLSINERISSAGVMELAASPFFAGLTVLDLSSNEIDEAGLQAIAAAKAFPHVHTVRISENRIGDEGIAALCQSSLLGRMLGRSSRLELRRNRIGPAGARALAACPLLSRCSALDLSHNPIEDEGLAALVESEHLGSLQVLKAGSALIGDGVLDRLRPHWPRLFEQLRALDLSENRLTDHAVMELRRYNRPGCVALDLSHNVQTVTGSSGQSRAFDEVAAAAELRRMVAHPALRRTGGPNANG